MKLVEEAIVVGALNVPLWFLCREVAKNFKVPESKVNVAASFLSGLAFHLLAERTGINAWYLKHGHAAMKEQQRLKHYLNHKEDGRMVCSAADQRAGVCALSTKKAGSARKV